MFVGLLASLLLDYNLVMCSRCRSFLFFSRLFLVMAVSVFVLSPAFAQKQQRPSPGRILLLPHSVISGDRATLAVLDNNGRLTPGVTVIFSNGDHLTTDATGRALFVAPLNPGVVFGSISGRPGRVPVTVVALADASPAAITFSSIPEVASLADRFEIAGSGFCGDADANRITVSGEPAFVLASSPTSLVVMPPADLPPGRASVDLSCAKRNGPPLEVVFVALSLEADASPLAPGVHRLLNVRVRGTTTKVRLEARNLAPDIADLTGGNPARVFTSGGAENLAHFEVVGRQRGSFLVSIHLLSPRTTSK